MEFLNPGMAWGFLSLPVIVFLYLLKRRYVPREVPSTYLWERTVQDMDVSHPFQRLRKNLLLPLQLLLASLLVLTLMHPVLPGVSGTDWVFVMDASASMQAVSGSGSRFNAALAEASGLVREGGRGDSYVLIRAGAVPETSLGRSMDTAEVQHALESMTCGYTQSDMNAALSLAHAVAGDTGRIVVFTDALLSDESVSIRAPEKAANAAVQAVQWEQGELFVRVQSYGLTGTRRLALYAGDTLLDARSLTLEAGQSTSLTIPAPEAPVYRAELLDSDALAADNIRYGMGPAESRYRIVLAGTQSRFLRAALKLREDADVVTAENVETAPDADLLVLDAPLRFVYPDAEATIRLGEEKQASGTVSMPGNLLGENITLQELAVRSLRPLSGGEAVLSMGEDTVLALGDEGAVFGFALTDTNLPVKVDFPLLVRWILDRLLPPRGAEGMQSVCGEPVTLPVRTADANLTVTGPDGHACRVESGTVYDTGLPGLYRVHVESDKQNQDMSLAVAVAESESDTMTVPASRETEESGHTRRSSKDMQPWALLLVLVCLFVEWEVSRRVA